MKPKSAITRFAKALNIPLDDVEELKDAIMERSGGDARANACMMKCFNLALYCNATFNSHHCPPDECIITVNRATDRIFASQQRYPLLQPYNMHDSR